MQSLLRLTALCAAVAPCFGQTSDFLGYASDKANSTLVSAQLEGAAINEPFVLFATQPGEQFDPAVHQPVATGKTDAFGAGRASFAVPPRKELPVGSGVDLWILTQGDQGRVELGPVTVPLSGPLSGGFGHCQVLDFDYAIGQVPDPVAGQVMGEDWALVGLHLSAVNNTPGHPSLPILFDSGDRTGGDDDLATPGRGQGNDTAYGNLLIIAEDDVDADRDGLVDDPDDEEHGGMLVFDFDNPVLICSLTVVDIDDGEKSFVRFWKGDVFTEIPLDDAGDNSVQTVSFFQERVTRMEIVLEGSGGLAEALIEPCPMMVNLDENPFGVPLDVSAGLVVTDQFQDLGVTFAAFNNTPGNPDKVVLFDSENPTGGDDDLMTPGRGVGNDEPLGLVVVIAENDVDADNDGLIDDPDDEAGGGTIQITFDDDVSFFSMRVLDVDGGESDTFEFYDENDALIELIVIDALGENSVQTVESENGPIVGVRRIAVVLGGSGAIARLRWCPGDHGQEE